MSENEKAILLVDKLRKKSKTDKKMIETIASAYADCLKENDISIIDSSLIEKLIVDLKVRNEEIILEYLNFCKEFDYTAQEVAGKIGLMNCIAKD